MLIIAVVVFYIFIVNKKINTPKESKMKTSSYSNKIEEYWPQIVKDLKQNGKIVLYTNLMNTRAKVVKQKNKIQIV